jgi:hypothetical protein
MYFARYAKGAAVSATVHVGIVTAAVASGVLSARALVKSKRRAIRRLD